MTNRKSHAPFRLVPKSTTLDDLELPIRILFHKRCGNCDGFLLNKGGVGKIRNFQPITRRISETVQDRTKVTRPCLLKRTEL